MMSLLSAAAGVASVSSADLHGLVHTHFGRVHPDCVLHVPSGTHIHETASGESARVFFPNGTVHAKARCPHAQRSTLRPALQQQHRHHAPASPPISSSDTPIWDGWPMHLWLGYSWANWSRPAFPADAAVLAFNASWLVPPPPSNTMGNKSDPWTQSAPTLSWWIGLQGPAVLQPVLEWNGLRSQAYGAVSWNCCPAGYVWHSDVLPAEPGDTIDGAMVRTAPGDAGHPHGGTYATLTTVRSPGKPLATVSLTTDTDHEAGGWLGNWVEAIAESYFVTSCEQLPCTTAGALGQGEAFAGLSLVLVDDDMPTRPYSPASIPWVEEYQVQDDGKPGAPTCGGKVTTNGLADGAGWANVEQRCE
jgi:hypothetical protein